MLLLLSKAAWHVSLQLGDSLQRPEPLLLGVCAEYGISQRSRKGRFAGYLGLG